MMQMNAKYLQITESIKRQISNGDFLIDRVPSERKLAGAFGVSYMTARRAVQQLLSDDVFIRSDNGRLALNPHFCEKELSVIMVLPNWPVPSLDKWRKALTEIVRERGGILKTVYFDHEDDSSIREALSGEYTRCFLVLARISELMRQHICALRDRVVLLHHDLTEYGLTCLDASSSDYMKLLVDHLYQFGHRRMALLNTQPENEVIRGRIEAFQQRVETLGQTITVFDSPVASFERADQKAYDLLCEKLRSGEFTGSAVVTTTIEAAIGALRAIHDCGKRPGKDISVCAFGGIEAARLSIPSITVTYTPEAGKKSRILLEDILDRRTPERLLYAWENMKIWQGESTGPAPGN